MKQRIRLIGGRYRGKQVTFPDQPTLRPTPDRVRETLFNWLMQDIREARCLDAFAGSGALGLEAFSRGAKEVVFLETDALTYRHLKNNVATFQSTQLTVLHQNACTYLQTHPHPFNIIFLDPPFQSTVLSQCLTLLEQTPLLAPEGLLYIESPEPVRLDPLHWEPLRAKQTGLVAYALFRARSLC